MGTLHNKILALPVSGGLVEGASEREHHAMRYGYKNAQFDAAQVAVEFDIRQQRLITLLRKARDEFKGLPHSLGYDFTHLPEIEAELAKWEAT